jgi:hypothetical protein
MDARGFWPTLKHAIVYAVVTAVVIFSVAFGLNGPGERRWEALAHRIDMNATIARTGVDSVVCILNIQPEHRTDRKVKKCMRKHGYLPYFTAGEESKP